MVIKTTAASRVTPTPRVGKLVRGALYVHCDAVDLVPAASQDRVALAIRAAPSAQWNVVRIELTSVGLLDYDEFEFPRLPAPAPLCKGWFARRRDDVSRLSQIV